jgi:hypothetical protein
MQFSPENTYYWDVYQKILIFSLYNHIRGSAPLLAVEAGD